MKGFRKIALLLLLLTLGITLAACRGIDKTDFVTYTVNWGGKIGEINYEGLKHDEDYGWVTSRDFYTLDGVYTRPNGQGERVFDAVGNLVVDELESGETFYAYWKPITVVLSFRLEGDATFEDGTDRKEMLVDYNGTLPDMFPAAKNGDGLDLGRWYLSKVNNKLVTSTTVTDQDGNLLEGKGKVADYCTEAPTPNTAYVLTFFPREQYVSCYVTLDFGDGSTEVLEYETYDTVLSKHFSHRETAGRELIGWARYPTERAEFVTKIDGITEDITLYAVWKNYRTVRLHLHNNRVKTVRVYQGEPILLDEAVALVGTAFENWYEDGDFNTVASRIVTYEDTTSDYYAKFVPKAELDEGSHRLTLVYESGVSEEFEVKAGQSIENCLWYGETATRELVSWIDGSDEPVMGGTIYSDTTLVAVWKS